MWYRFFIAFAFLTIASCVSDDGTHHTGIYNQGNVSYDGVNIPITYADFFLKANVEGGEVWSLVLSQEFIGYGSTYSDAFLYLELFKPNNQPIVGIYDVFHPMRTLDFMDYFENVVLYNGIPNTYEFHIPNHSFVDGRVEVVSFGSNHSHFEVRLMTFDGKWLTAYFDGKIQY